MKPDVVVVGGGAAGLLAALAAARGGRRVLVLEAAKDAGRKILVSGGGRCNVLPMEDAPARFISESPNRLVQRFLDRWPLSGQRLFFEELLGGKLREEPESRKLFPPSNRAKDVRDALREALAAAGATLRAAAPVRDLVRAGEGFAVRLDGGEEIAAPRVILATGGRSVLAGGADAAGYEWAASRLEAAAGRAVRDDKLKDVLAILQVFLRHQQAADFKAPMRERAARAVESIAAGNAVPYLVRHLGAPAGVSTEDFSAVLVSLGSRVVPPLMDRLATGDQKGIREHLAPILLRLMETAQSEVAQALPQMGEERAVLLASIFGEIGGEGCVTLLAWLFRHRDARVRLEAVRRLGRIGGTSTHRPLLQALRDSDPAVLELAVGLVGKGRMRLATPTLLRLAGQRALAGKPFAVRKAAIAALGTMGEQGSVPTLAGLLRTRTWYRRAAGEELRLAAALALLEMGRPEAREVVEAGANSRRADVGRACAAALRRVAESSPATE